MVLGVLPGGLSTGALFKQIETLKQKGGIPTVLLLDDADRYFNNKKISETDLTFLDPNQFYMSNPDLNSVVRLPDITIIIVNDLKHVAVRLLTICKATWPFMCY